MRMLIFSKKATSLPYGLQKKLEIAHALATKPKLVYSTNQLRVRKTYLGG